MNIESQQEPNWIEEIKRANLNLRPFNDVITGYQSPAGYGEPVATNVILNGTLCDIYHTDQKPGDTSHRVFIYKKSASN